jgi:hypothetical protein
MPPFKFVYSSTDVYLGDYNRQSGPICLFPFHKPRGSASLSILCHSKILCIQKKVWRLSAPDMNQTFRESQALYSLAKMAHDQDQKSTH